MKINHHDSSILRLSGLVNLFLIQFFLNFYPIAQSWADSNQKVIPYETFSGDDTGDKIGNEISNGDTSLKKSHFLPSSKINFDEMMTQDEDQSPFLHQSVPDQDYKKPAADIRGHNVLGEFLETENYLNYTNRDILDEIRGLEKERLTLTFIRDDFSYTNDEGNFEKIYRDHKENSVRAMILCAYDLYYFNSFLNGYYGLGSGMGYNSGRGAVPEESSVVDSDYIDRVRFNLFTLPLDLRLGFELELTRYFSFNFVAGPSLMAIVENRNDRSHEDGDRNKIQFGSGYFMAGNLRIFLSSLIQRLGIKLYNSNKVSRFSINVNTRVQSYDHFKEEGLLVSGKSFGIGFTYDFF